MRRNLCTLDAYKISPKELGIWKIYKRRSKSTISHITKHEGPRPFKEQSLKQRFHLHHWVCNIVTISVVLLPPNSIGEDFIYHQQAYNVYNRTHITSSTGPRPFKQQSDQQRFHLQYLVHIIECSPPTICFWLNETTNYSQEWKVLGLPNN